MTATTAVPISSNRRMAAYGLFVMAAFMVGRVVGVLDDVVKARLFGTSGELGAYIAAFTLPELLNNLLSAGALAGAFIPIYTEVVARGDRQAAWRVASSVLNLTFLMTAAFGVLLLVFAPWLSSTLILPGYSPEHQMLNANLMRFLVLSMVLFSVGGLATSVLNAHQHFLLPAIAPIFYNVGVVAGAVFLAPTYGVWGLAYGAVGGAVLNVLIQIPGLLYYGMRWRPVLDWRDADVRRIILLMIPRMAGVAVFYLNNLAVANNLASRLPDEGAVAALSYAWRIQQIPATVIGLSAATVVFPTLAALVSTHQTERLRETFSWALRVMIVLSVPAAFAVVVLGRAAIGVVLEGGAFGATSTEQVMFALQFYALGLVAYSLLDVVARMLFAQQDTRTPLYVAAGALVANVLLGLALLGPLGHGGLALAGSLATTGEVLVLLVIIRHRLSGIDARGLLVTLARALAAALAMTAVVLAVLALGGPLAAGLSAAGLSARTGLLVKLVLAAVMGLAAYVGVALLLGSREIRALSGLIRRGRAAGVPAGPVE